MKWYKILCLILLFGFDPISSLGQFQLKIEITNLRSDEGEISLELFNDKEHIIKKMVRNIKDQKCTITIDSLENARYAIRYFHDENSNKELDKNWLGMPKEGYGFSNDAYGTFGPKDFKEWLFVLDADKVVIFKTQY